MKNKRTNPQEEKPFSDLPRGKRILANCISASLGILPVLIFAVLSLHFLIPKGSWINIVEGSSMSPTLNDGQIIFSEMQDIQRGDVVTAFFPKNFRIDNTAIVKRVIGLPGEHIRIDVVGVYVDGKPLDESYLTADSVANTYRETPYNNVTLDENQYYIVGDNRFVSNDSRSFGPVEAEDILYVQADSPGINFWVRLALVVFILTAAFFLHGFTDALSLKFTKHIFSGKGTGENV